ncbi:5-oxoprolinase subunit PxpA [Foetidibacter luteolus]|uniref:5-oxoprolinase subunit PxpA n=1 Tax=Foetidibacter luteolus TaxID=2608880 RepID=UPI00129A62AD|nr:5-oxoprolinase subunit PxpA [Foetidibacter luteolus]
MTITTDLNCDIGEGLPNDALLMSFISSANIACGYHAGNADTMRHTIALCLHHGVAIGAHPGFADKENFGRKEQVLADEGYYQLMITQLGAIKKIADELDAPLHHVKPHGALYNMSAANKQLACVIARAVKDFNASLLLYGLSGSHSIAEAKAIGLRTASEVFADRTYQNNGSLTPRSQPNAFNDSTDKAVKQALQMVTRQTVNTVDDAIISVTADTICLHGDGKHAVNFAKEIYHAFKENNIVIQSAR